MNIYFSLLLFIFLCLRISLKRKIESSLSKEKISINKGLSNEFADNLKCSKSFLFVEILNIFISGVKISYKLITRLLKL